MSKERGMYDFSWNKISEQEILKKTDYKYTIHSLEKMEVKGISPELIEIDLSNPDYAHRNIVYKNLKKIVW